MKTFLMIIFFRVFASNFSSLIRGLRWNENTYSDALIFPSVSEQEEREREREKNNKHQQQKRIVEVVINIKHV